jgi:hypothetical protein
MMHSRYSKFDNLPAQTPTMHTTSTQYMYRQSDTSSTPQAVGLNVSSLAVACPPGWNSCCKAIRIIDVDQTGGDCWAGSAATDGGTAGTATPPWSVLKEFSRLEFEFNGIYESSARA